MNGDAPMINRRDLLIRGSVLAALIVAGGGSGCAPAVMADMAAKPLPSELSVQLCRLVLPATATPGAAEAGVPTFLPVAFDHGLFGGDASTLTNLESALDKRTAGGRFVSAPGAEQLQVLERLDIETFSRPRSQRSATSAAADAPAAQGAQSEYDLWRVVKDAIVCSYYTTEIGGAQELAFDLVPGDTYRADVATADVPYLSNFWLENVF